MRGVPADLGRPRDQVHRHDPVPDQVAHRLLRRGRHRPAADGQRPALGENGLVTAAVVAPEPVLVPGHRHRDHRQMRHRLPGDLPDPARRRPAARAARLDPRRRAHMHGERPVRLPLDQFDLDTGGQPQQPAQRTAPTLEHTHPSVR
ncbi:hypothetical protein [Frankia symbiont of Coriaria ruscifolia]|uniref:hypothetical protein n=1 Tax=Protofrankia symbiont of Coriaria ruscifolia TaxID=1306542 RepID=UPI001040E29D